MRREILVAITVLVAVTTTIAGQSAPADLVIINGTVHTVTPGADTVDAVAVRHGRIAAVGSDQRIRNWIGPSTQVIDASGLAVYPGFIDAHAHPIPMGFAQRDLNLSEVTSYEELVQTVAQAARNLQAGEWILGGGWHQSKWDRPSSPEVRGFPTHEQLSAAVPDNPVFLFHASGHAALANARALSIAGITSRTASPEGGEIIIGPDGKPTGVLVEAAAELVESHVPRPTPEYLARLVESALQEAAANGITTVHDAAADRATLAVYQRFAGSGRLPVRINAMLVPGRSGEDFDFLREWFDRGPLLGGGDGFLTVRTVKIFVDGALGSRGARLLEPYADAEGTGHLLVPLSVVEETAAAALASGFQVATHAIGDRAIREVLDIYEKVLSGRRGEDARFRIEHAQHIAEADIPRFAELGVIASMQGIHMASDIAWAIDRLGPERIAEGAYVWRKLLDAGAVVANGSDAPVEPIDPIAGFYASVTRRTLEGEIFPWSHPEQAMTRREALRSFTSDAAYASFDEETKGSIEVGKVADFTILSHDITTASDDQILRAAVVYTIVDGEVVYSR